MDVDDAHSSISSCDIGSKESPNEEESFLPNDKHNNTLQLQFLNGLEAKKNEPIMKIATNTG